MHLISEFIDLTGHAVHSLGSPGRVRTALMLIGISLLAGGWIVHAPGASVPAKRWETRLILCFHIMVVAIALVVVGSAIADYRSGAMKLLGRGHLFGHVTAFAALIAMGVIDLLARFRWNRQ